MSQKCAYDHTNVPYSIHIKYIYINVIRNNKVYKIPGNRILSPNNKHFIYTSRNECSFVNVCVCVCMCEGGDTKYIYIHSLCIIFIFRILKQHWGYVLVFYEHIVSNRKMRRQLFVDGKWANKGMLNVWNEGKIYKWMEWEEESMTLKIWKFCGLNNNYTYHIKEIRVCVCLTGGIFTSPQRKKKQKAAHLYVYDRTSVIF